MDLPSRDELYRTLNAIEKREEPQYKQTLAEIASERRDYIEELSRDADTEIERLKASDMRQFCLRIQAEEELADVKARAMRSRYVMLAEGICILILICLTWWRW